MRKWASRHSPGTSASSSGASASNAQAARPVAGHRSPLGRFPDGLPAILYTNQRARVGIPRGGEPMATEIQLPEFGENVEGGELVDVQAAPGPVVKQRQALPDVEA